MAIDPTLIDLDLPRTVSDARDNAEYQQLQKIYDALFKLKDLIGAVIVETEDGGGGENPSGISDFTQFVRTDNSGIFTLNLPASWTTLRSVHVQPLGNEFTWEVKSATADLIRGVVYRRPPTNLLGHRRTVAANISVSIRCTGF